jgi:hypothetical protein
MIAGRVVLDNGRITTVDERKIEQAVEDAARTRLYLADDQVRRWRQLGLEVEPYLFDFYKDWSAVDLDPASIYNVRRPPTLG